MLSFILCNYNDSSTLLRALQAIESEAADRDEIIVLDDCSTDGSQVIILDWLESVSKCEVKFIENDRNMGLIPSSNRALNAATKAFVGLFSANDQLKSGLGNSVRLVGAAYPDIGAIAHEVEIVDDRGRCREYNFHQDDRLTIYSSHELARKSSDYYFWLPTSGAFLNRKKFSNEGGWINELQWLADWFAMYVVSYRYGVACVKEVGSIVYEDPNSYGKIGMKCRFSRQTIQKVLLGLLLQRDFYDVRRFLLDCPSILITGVRLTGAMALRQSLWNLDLFLSMNIHRCTRRIRRWRSK